MEYLIERLHASDAASALINKAAREIERLRAELAALRAPADEAVWEAAARALFESRAFHGDDSTKMPWVTGGNSIRQCEARLLARAALSAVVPMVRMAERERCAKIAYAFLDATSSGRGEVWKGDDEPRSASDVLDHLPDAVAAAIRAGGNDAA